MQARLIAISWGAHVHFARAYAGAWEGFSAIIEGARFLLVLLLALWTLTDFRFGWNLIFWGLIIWLFVLVLDWISKRYELAFLFCLANEFSE